MIENLVKLLCFCDAMNLLLARAGKYRLYYASMDSKIVEISAFPEATRIDPLPDLE